jgi:predicted transcriptional regulator
MTDLYFNPGEPVHRRTEDGLHIEIPSSQQRMRADRKYFSIKDGTKIRIDVDEEMMNNHRPVLESLAKLVGISSPKKLKKPELAHQLQERFHFISKDEEEFRARKEAYEKKMYDIYRKAGVDAYQDWTPEGRYARFVASYRM